MVEVGGSVAKEASPSRDWTSGSVIRNLLLLFWPMLIKEGFTTMGQTVDMIWVGKLGASSIAGLGVATILIMLAMVARVGIFTGSRAMIARFVGAGDVEGANHVARQTFIIGAAQGIVLTVIGVVFAEPILRLLGLEADVVVQGAAYMRITFAGWLTTSFWVVSFNIMNASGDTVTPMKISIFTRSIHLLLAPFLILGWWVFPRLGVSGAALTNVISQGLGMLISLWVLFTGRTRLRLTLAGFRLDFNTIWRIVKIGIPASVTGMQRAFGSIVLTWFMAPFGTVAVAAHSLAQRVQIVLVLPGAQLGRAAGVLVGQNLGARQPGRAGRSGWLAVGLAEGVMFIGAVAVLLWAESIVRIFNTEPSLVQSASIFLRIAAAGYLVIGLVVVLEQSIAGAGDTLPPMLISLVMVWMVQLPLAFLLPRVTDLGVYGVRWSIVAGTVVGAVSYIVYFWLGRWKRKQV